MVFYQSKSSKPTIPNTIKTIETIFVTDTGSLNHIIPMTAINAVPQPAQMAYATLTSSFFRTKMRQTKHIR